MLNLEAESALSKDFKSAGLYEELLLNLEKSSSVRDAKFVSYQRDPVGFGQDILGDTYTDDIKRMMESVRDYPITLAVSANAVGKTHGAARVAAWWYRCFPGSQVYTFAAPPEGNLKRLLWGEIGDICDRHPTLFENHKLSNLLIQRSAKSFLVGVTIPTTGTAKTREAKFSGKHAPYILFVGDEGDAVPDEVYAGIESCMSGGVARLLIMFNPRQEIGAPYRMERDGRANVVYLSAFSHPNVISGQEVIPGAVTRETTVRRIHEWCRPVNEGENGLTAEEVFELPQFLVGATALDPANKAYPPLRAGKYLIKDPAFSYMVLGQYPAQSAYQLISKEWTTQARQRYDLWVLEHGEGPPGGIFPICGLDAADDGDAENVFTSRYGSLVLPPVVWQGVNAFEASQRATLEAMSRDSEYTAVDGTGVGAGIAPAMRSHGLIAYSVKVANKPTEETEMGRFRILRDQLLWSVREWLRTDPSAMLPPDEMLLEELHTVTYREHKGYLMMMPKDEMIQLLRRSPDRMDSLALTFAPVDRQFDHQEIQEAFG